MLNLKFLHTFCTLAELGSFTKAAERLYMTQSGVSQHIMKLEQALDMPLLVRKGKGFSLTDAGQRLNREAREIIKRMQELELNLSQDDPYEGEVRMMSPGSVGLKLYPHFLRVQSLHPKLIMDYRFAPNNDIDKAIINNKIDLGFMTRLSSLPDLVCCEVAREALLLVTPAGMEQPSWAELMDMGFIDHPDAPHYANLLLGANYPEFLQSDKFPKKGFSNQVSLLLEPVSLGLGFTVLPAHAVGAFTRQHLIKAHPLSKPVSEIVYAVEHRDKARSKRVATVIAEAKAKLNA